MEKRMKGILKWPLIITAVMVVVRVVLEQAGVSDTINNLISVAAMTVIICPLYFAIRIGQSGIAHPYLTHFKLTALYAVLARAMILPTYWLARVFEWPQPRFFGLYGPDVTPFTGWVGLPLLTAAFWIVPSVVVGGALGSIVIAVTRKGKKPAPTGIPTRS
jgi:hypothetical protein